MAERAVGNLAQTHHSWDSVFAKSQPTLLITYAQCLYSRNPRQVIAQLLYS